MKVLLIQPPFTVFKTEAKTCQPPLGLAYLAAVLKEDHEVSILDALAEGHNEEAVINNEFIRYGLSFENIKKRVERLSPDVVGISCLFSAQSRNALRICELVKEVNKKIITMVGGAHPSTLPERMLEDNNIDFVVIGEGEETLINLLECLEHKKEKNIQDLDGVGFKCNGNAKINRKHKYITELDSLPFPYWDIFPLEKYFRINTPHGGSVRNVPFLPIITSRGCPFECIFCSIRNLWGRNYRKRSIENVLAELDYLVKKYGVKEVLFEDDNLTLDKERAKKFFRGMINKKLNISSNMPNGIAIQTLDDELLELMKMSGCYSISFGVESGDEYVLKNIIKKPITVKMVKPVIDKAKKLGLETAAFFVVGFPGETRTQLSNTFRLAEDLDVDNINFSFANPLPGTRLLRECEEKGLIKGNYDHSQSISDYPIFPTETFSIHELRSLVARERIKLYFLFLLRHPLKFIYKLWSKFLNDPKYYVRFILKYQKINRRYDYAHHA